VVEAFGINEPYIVVVPNIVFVPVATKFTANKLVAVAFVSEAFVAKIFVVVASVNVALFAHKLRMFANQFVEEETVPVAKVNVPVAFRLVIVAFSNCRLEPVAFRKSKLSIDEFNTLNHTENKLVVVALVSDALVAKIFVDVELVMVALVKVALFVTNPFEII
jgi:hypothetical protein